MWRAASRYIYTSLPKRRHGGLLEYQAMPFLDYVAHGGVLCTFINRSAPGRVSGVVRQGRRHGPSITYKITSCWVNLLQPAMRAAVLDQPSRLRTHCIYSTVLVQFVDAD
jgi:hypothetical protein